MLADELQFAPQPIEFRPASVVEQQPTKRLVLAVVQEDATLSVSGDDRFEEDRRREEGTKLHSRSSLFGSDARMDDRRDSRVTRSRLRDRLGQATATARGSDHERLNRSRFRTGLVETHIGAKEPRQREQLLQRLRKFRQVNDHLGPGRCDQRGFWHGPILRMLTEPDPARCFNCLS